MRTIILGITALLLLLPVSAFAEKSKGEGRDNWVGVIKKVDSNNAVLVVGKNKKEIQLTGAQEKELLKLADSKVKIFGILNKSENGRSIEIAKFSKVEKVERERQVKKG